MMTYTGDGQKLGNMPVKGRLDVELFYDLFIKKHLKMSLYYGDCHIITVNCILEY